MASKFLLSFGRALGGSPAHHEYLLPVPEERQANSLYAPPLVIVSTGLLERRDRRPDLDRIAAVDIALVDEAHDARRRNPTQGSRGDPEYGQLYSVIQQALRPKSRSLWLATATPMQLEAVEVADLMALTRRVGAFQYDPSLTQAYYDILSRLVGQRPVTTPEWEFLRRAVLAVDSEDPLRWDFLRRTVIDGRTRSAVRRWLEQNRVPRPVDLPGVQRLIFSSAPLSRVMLRHTRPLLEIYRAQGQLQDNLARRHILPMPRIVFTDQERQAYEQLEAYCRGLAAQMARHGTPQSRSAVGFLLSFLRLRFASSLFAIRETVRRRLERVETTLAGMTPTNIPKPDDERSNALGDEDEDNHDATVTYLQQRTPEDLQWECLQLRGLRRTLDDCQAPPPR